MIVPDVNLLLYAYVPAYPEHGAARAWLEAALSGTDEVGFTDVAVFGFLRLVTNRRVYTTPMTVDQAADRIESWFQTPSGRMLTPGPRHLQIALRLARALGTAGSLTTDIQLAAYAIENQAEVHSNDNDFARFPGLRWTNPLKKR